MKNKTAIIAGGTGLVGSYLLELLLESDYQKVISVSRRRIDIENPKLAQIIIDFDDLHTLEGSLQGDHVFCCLGSTIKKATSKEKFILFDYTYPVELAAIALSNGASQFHIVSSSGADSKSMFFYNRVKGDVEKAISAMDYKSIHIYRPSLLLGERNEFRPGEKIGEYLSFAFYPFFSLFKNYKPVKASKVAKAMFNSAKREEAGIFYHPSKEIQQYD